MILELLKLKSLVATRLIERGESVMVKRYERKMKLENQISAVESGAARALTLEDIEGLLERNNDVTLHVEGREVTLSTRSSSASAPALAPASATLSVEPAIAASSSSTVTETVAEEDGTEAALAETILETIVVPEPSDELLSEINGIFGEITYSPADVDEIIASIGKPKNVVSCVAEELPLHNSTMAIAKLSIRRPDEEDEILTGTFISASVFSGCGDEGCDSCGEGGVDEEGAIILHYIPEDTNDRSVMTIELEPGLITTLAL